MNDLFADKTSFDPYVYVVWSYSEKNLFCVCKSQSSALDQIRQIVDDSPNLKITDFGIKKCWLYD